MKCSSMFATMVLLLAITSPVVRAGSSQLDLSKLDRPNYDEVVATTDKGDFIFRGDHFPSMPGSILGLFAGFDDRRKGAVMEEQYGLIDPSIEISKRIAERISKNLTLPLVESSTGRAEKVKINLRSPKDIAHDFGPRKIVVLVRSLATDIAPVKKDKLRINYMSVTDVIDTTTRKRLVRDVCTYETPKADAKPSVDLLANDAIELKREIERVGNECARQFVETKLLEGAI